MKFPSFLLLCSAVLLSACGSLPERVGSRFDDAPAQSRDFAGTPDQVYRAAQKAFRRVDFVLVRSSPGRIEAASSIHSSTAFGDSRQLVALVRIRELENGKCGVELSLTEDVASSSVGGTRRTPLREHSFFGLYFAMLQQVLSEQDPGVATGK